jgi:hypothetical protein
LPASRQAFTNTPENWGDQFDLAFELSTDNSVYLYPKGISTETEVSAEVFGIDIVHAVEFSKIGCF